MILKNKKAIITAIVVVILVGLISIFAAEAVTTQDRIEQTISTVAENPTELVVEEFDTFEKDFNKAIDVNKIYEDHLKVLQQAETLTLAKKEKVMDLTETQMIVTEEINQLKLGNPELVKKYFGESQKFTPEIVADRVSTANVHFIVNTEKTNILYAHICTLDYVKIVKDFIDSTESDIALGIADGNYNICYTIQVEVDENGVVITEALKEAITGGWYESELKSSSCIF